MTAGLNNRPKEWSRPPEPTCRTRDVGAAATSGDRHRLRLSRRGSTRWPLARSREDRMRDPLVAYAGDLPSERIARLRTKNGQAEPACATIRDRWPVTHRWHRAGGTR